jgi:hypothetical protein
LVLGLVEVDYKYSDSQYMDLEAVVDYKHSDSHHMDLDQAEALHSYLDL